MTDKLTEVMKILGITRVVAKPLAKQVSPAMGAAFADEEMWFGPDGEVIGGIKEQNHDEAVCRL